MTDSVAGRLTSSRPRHGAVSITPRNIRFMKAPAAAATWLGGNLVATAVFNALSLTFPDGERMFMDAVRHFNAQIPKSRPHVLIA